MMNQTDKELRIALDSGAEQETVYVCYICGSRAACGELCSACAGSIKSALELLRKEGRAYCAG